MWSLSASTVGVQDRERIPLSLHDDPGDALDPFFADGSLVEIHYQIKSGKEATVYCATAGPSIGGGLVAAKVYRPDEARSFRNDGVYNDGRYGRVTREIRAMRSHTAFGKQVRMGAWTAHERETLRTLAKAGADVPQPIAVSERAILETFVGDEDGPAPLLAKTRLDDLVARDMFEQVMANIELMLKLNIIHADLSPYNILVWQNRAVIIDVPQAIDPRFNHSARELLLRDVTNVTGSFRKYGVDADPDRITRTLWWRFVNADL